MVRVRNKGYWGVLLGPKTVVAVILLAIIISVVSRIFGAVFTQSVRTPKEGNGRLTLLSTTTESDGISQPGLNEPEIKAEPAQPRPAPLEVRTGATAAAFGGLLLTGAPRASINEHRVSSIPLDNSGENPGQSDEWQTVRMRVTAYCPCERCCGEYADGITACGHEIRPGDAFAAADRTYSFGTEMVVAGYNNGEPIRVLDRGGAIRGNRLDVFFHSHEAALQWGVKYVDVKVRQDSQTQ